MDKLTITNQMLTYKIILNKVKEISKSIQYQGNQTEIQSATHYFNGLERAIIQHTPNNFLSFDQNLSELNILITLCWEKLTSDLCKYLLDKIDTRKTKGGEFCEIQQSLKKVLDDIDENNVTTYEDYDLVANNVLEIAERIDEKISNEKYNIKQFWKSILMGAVIGFVIGVCSGYILWVILPK